MVGRRIAAHPIFSNDSEITINPIPALYTSKLLSRSFWEDATIPRKSDNFFHRIDLISAKSTYKHNTAVNWAPLTVDYNKIYRGEVDPGQTEMGK
jgi:hypothetical protein